MSKTRAIDANVLKEKWAKVVDDMCEGITNGSIAHVFARLFVGEIDSAPTLDTERHGEWIDTGWVNGYGQCLCECSICSEKEPDTKRKSHCPYCGAKMGESKET